MLDVLIRGGTVVDGTGTPGVRADVGIRAGRIAEIGAIADSATRIIDAAGCVVAPGFIDMHTHLDAQVLWDAELTPSCLHGVTTVIGGNCGFAIAPVDQSSADYILHMLAAVEGMPPTALEAGVDFAWRSWAEWTSRFEGRTALNCGFLAGHSTIRRLVMGEDWRQPADDGQIDRMAALVDESVRAGALGFSSSWNNIHADHQGNPVPSRFARPEELVRLAGVLRDKPGTTIGFQAGSQPYFTDEAFNAMADMSAAAGGKRLDWNAITVGAGVPEQAIRHRLDGSSKAAAERGGSVYALLVGVATRAHMSPLTGILYHATPYWSSVFSLPPEERIRAFGDPDVRARMAAELAEKGDVLRTAGWLHTYSVESVLNPELQPLVGRRLTDIAQDRGCTLLESFLDLSIADKLQITFLTDARGDDPDSWRLRQDLWNDPRTIIGASDAGAHLDMNSVFTYFTDLLGPSVRDRKLLSLEEAVYRLTDQPARFNGLKDRGRLEVGYHADVVVFDPDTIRPAEVTMKPDMPGGEPRIYAEAVGVHHVLVNGVQVVDGARATGATPGVLLRSGRDTVDAPYTPRAR